MNKGKSIIISLSKCIVKKLKFILNRCPYDTCKLNGFHFENNNATSAHIR